MLLASRGQRQRMPRNTLHCTGRSPQVPTTNRHPALSVRSAKEGTTPWPQVLICHPVFGAITPPSGCHPLFQAGTLDTHPPPPLTPLCCFPGWGALPAALHLPKAHFSPLPSPCRPLPCCPHQPLLPLPAACPACLRTQIPWVPGGHLPALRLSSHLHVMSTEDEWDPRPLVAPTQPLPPLPGARQGPWVTRCRLIVGWAWALEPAGPGFKSGLYLAV